MTLTSKRVRGIAALTVIAFAIVFYVSGF